MVIAPTIPNLMYLHVIIKLSHIYTLYSLHVILQISDIQLNLHIFKSI
jgi:hypothetical protein